MSFSEVNMRNFYQFKYGKVRDPSRGRGSENFINQSLPPTM